MAKELKIFSKTRLRFNQLYDDAINYLKSIYGHVGETYTNASPFGQLLRVILHLGRMIFYYIEDSITELNINTAVRESSVKGLATLTGHNPYRGTAARGSIKLTYNNNSDYRNQTVTIPNYTQIINYSNGLKYFIVLPSENLVFHLATGNIFTNISIIQGEMKYQQATGTGYALQSYSFALGNNSTGIVDHFFTNVYVNGERWRNVDSILDMGFDEKACMIKTGMNNSIDIFFGNGVNGAVPPEGSTILFEYVFCQGEAGNIDALNQTSNNNWKFENEGYLPDGSTIDLNELITISTDGDILFGTTSESTALTRLLAPNTSRSYVLANTINYEYFLRRMGIFSVIDAIQGFNTYNDIKTQYQYSTAQAEYTKVKENYIAQSNLTGSNSEKARELYNQMIVLKEEVKKYKNAFENSKLDDNTIYLFLIPDISKRISNNENYFTCDENSFLLTNNEKNGIIELIRSSGQQMLTIDNIIVDPVSPRFAINIFIQIWEEYDFDNIKNSIIKEISNYLIANKRRDRMPVSDLISVVEKIEGIDSVTITFDADKNNDAIYGTGNYGIDEYGDVLLSRSVRDYLGNNIDVKDVYPLFRGGFVSFNDVEYSNDISDGTLGPINITLRGITRTKGVNSKSYLI